MILSLYNLNLISTTPTVIYKVYLKDKNVLEVDNPSMLPIASEINEIHEPIICASMFLPKDYVGNVITLCEQKSGKQKKISYIGNQVQIQDLYS